MIASLSLMLLCQLIGEVFVLGLERRCAVQPCAAAMATARDFF